MLLCLSEDGVGLFPRRATTAAASRPEASPGRLARCIRVAGLKKLPRFPGTLLDPRLSALKQIDHKRLPKQYQTRTHTKKSIKNEHLAVTLRQDARRAALAADAAPTVICFPGQPHRGDGRGVEPARLDPRNLGRGKGLGALRPGERAPRVAGPGISRVAGERIVAKTHVGARNIRRGERVGGGHASAAMSDAVC
jgi:hypothetical protein